MKSGTDNPDVALAAEPDVPEEADLSRAVRGRHGRALVTEVMRYRRALRAIVAMETPDGEPEQAVRAMKDCARLALQR